MSKHIIENQSQNGEKEEIGNNLEDFDIFEILEKQAYGFIAKVKSKKNKKIYCMKIIDFSLVNDNNEIDQFINEINITSKLNNPNIVKYYTNFQNNNKNYIITEYIDNNLKKYITANLCIKRAIPEQEIWELLYQTLSGLTYIQKENLIHRDIKPENLYLTDDKKVKIGNFWASVKRKNSGALFQKEIIKIGTSLYMSPEMHWNHPYGSKVDIYSLGCTFYELCFFSVPRNPIYGVNLNGEMFVDIKDIPPNYNLNLYTSELIKVINAMIEKDQNKRPSIDIIFNKVKEKYNLLKMQSSSIFCVYRCLINFPTFINKCETSLSLPETIINHPISYSLLLAKQNMLIQVNASFPIINHIRDILIYNNSTFPDPGEIECIDLLDFIIKKVFIESNQNKNCVSSNLYTEENDIDTYNRDTIFRKYYKNFSNFFGTFVADLFFGIFELNRICLQCKTNRTFFENFYYLTININTASILGYNPNDKNFINNCLQNNLKIQTNKYCPKCNTITLNEEKKEIFSSPLNLIIYIKNEDQNNNIKFNFPILMNLPNKMKSIDSINFYLKSVIYENIQNDQRIYECSVKYNNNWYFLNGYNLSDCKDSPYNFNYDKVIMLFYSSFND